VFAVTSAPPAPANRPYRPYGALRELMLCRDAEVLVEGPAGCGKTLGCLNKVHACLEKYPGARWLLARKTRESLTESALKTFEEQVLPEGSPLLAGADRANRRRYDYANGSELVVAGLDQATKIYSAEYDGVYVPEATELSEDDWERLGRALRHNVMPYQQALADCNPGPELHWLNQRAEHGLMRRLVASHADNPTLTPAYLDRLARMTGPRRDSLYLGRWSGDVEGSYYAKLLHEAREQGRIVKGLPIDPARPVYVSWDFGISDFTTLWFWQVAGRQRWAIDYYEMSGEGLGHYGAVLRRKSQRYGYAYAGFYLPHDAEARIDAISVAVKRIDVLRELFPGVRMTVVPRVGDVEAERVEAMRNLIPLTYWDNSRAPAEDPEARNTATGLQHLIAYKREFNESTGTFAARPKHDKASHAADSAGTFAQGWTEPVVVPPPTTARLFG
jgi:hypothetical protein